MSEREQTEEISGVGGGLVATPLDAILGGDEAPVSSFPDNSSPQESASPDERPRDDDDGVSVPLAALRRERERRQATDQRVAELEEEIRAYHEQKWGLPPEQPQAEPAPPDLALQQEREKQAFAFNESYARFVGKHGKEHVEAIDAALKELPPQHQEHVIALVSQGDGDPMERVAAYVEQLGLLDAGFKPTSLQDALAGKVSLPADHKRHADEQRLAQIEERQQKLEEVERRVNFNASRVEFVTEFGRNEFNALDKACETFANSGDPRASQFKQMLMSAQDPIRLAARAMHHLGLWSPHQEQARPAQTVMPSNIVGARNVGARSGPSFAGPTPLKDIFAR